MFTFLFTPSTRRQKTKTKRLGEIDLLSFDENSNPIEQKRTDTFSGSASHNDTEAFSDNRSNLSRENKITDFSFENEIPRRRRLAESMENFSLEINEAL